MSSTPDAAKIAFADILAASGVELIQYRNKQAPSGSLLQISLNLVKVLNPRHVRVIVNDRPDIARLADAGGVHVGQEDLQVEDARAMCGTERWVGVSTHTLDQVREASKTSADYIAVGPIFVTDTKQNPDPIVGVDFIRRARQLTNKPLVAIGGINLGRAAEAFRAGADSVAVALDLRTGGDPVPPGWPFATLCPGPAGNTSICASLTLRCGDSSTAGRCF